MNNYERNEISRSWLLINEKEISKQNMRLQNPVWDKLLAFPLTKLSKYPIFHEVLPRNAPKNFKRALKKIPKIMKEI